MNIIIEDKSFHKKDKYTQKIINKGIKRLMERLSQYNGTDIDKIFGDNILIHDIIDKDKYVFKSRVNNVQLRILYTIIDGDLIILSHWCKKQTGKEYIRYFENLYNKPENLYV